MTIFKVEKVSNMIFITDNTDQIWRAWNIEEFTQRKLKNAMNKIKSSIPNAVFNIEL